MSWLFDHAAPARSVGERPAEWLAALTQEGERAVALLEFVAIESACETDPAARPDSPPDDPAIDEARERAQVVAAMIEAAREEARDAMRASLDEEMKAAERAQQVRVERLVQEFARDRQRFFSAAEAQVVELALAIARQVLAREMAQDPMHLAGAVRAVLRTIQEEIGTVLHVAPSEAEAWRTLLASASGAQVQVVADGQMEPGACVLQTAIGRIELGVTVQMAEIERGFRERMPGQVRDEA